MGGFEQVVLQAVVPSKQSARSPLRYPGGKSKAVEFSRAYVPQGTKKLAAPFLGGGSVELACAASGIKVYGADAFGPLVNFWEQVKTQPVLLAERVRRYHLLSKPKFYSLQKSGHFYFGETGPYYFGLTQRTYQIQSGNI